MKWIISWFSSVCIIAGGLYTIYYFNHLLAEKKERYEQSSGIFKTFNGAFYSIDEALYTIPITAGTLIAVIGVITIWERDIIFVFLSIFLALFLFNWIGSLLSIVGAIIIFAVWRKHPNEKQTKKRKPIFAILGWIFALTSLVFIPALFGILGVICGLLHRRINIVYGNLILSISIAFPLPGSITSILVEELIG